MNLELLARNTTWKIFSNLHVRKETHHFEDVLEIVLSSYERLYLQARKDQINKVNITEQKNGSLIIGY